MELEIKICKSDQLTDSEWKSFAESFKTTFEEGSTAEKKREFYSNNPFGYSYHALAKDRETVVGHTSLIPRWYNIDGKQMIFGISGGTFVCPEYRNDIFLFKKMYSKLKNVASEDGMAGTLGVPNDNSFKYAVKILNKKHIGDLEFYALPINAGTVLNSNLRSVLNPLSKIFVKSWFLLNRLWSVLDNRNEVQAKFRLNLSEEFLACRFKKGYVRRVEYGVEIVYKIENENGVKTAYIMHLGDEEGFSFRDLVWGVGSILKNESIDLILYVGRLNLRQCLLLRVPGSKKPKRLPLTIDMMDQNYSIESISEIKDWKFGLIDFDVR